jgi:hypothetical protein
MGAPCGDRTVAESQPMSSRWKRRQYYKRTVKLHYGGELRGLAHNQLFQQRGLRGTTLGPANRGRRLSAAERQAIEQKMRDEGRL